MKLNTVVEDLNRVVVEAYEASYPAKTVTSSRNIPYWKRNPTRMGTKF